MRNALVALVLFGCGASHADLQAPAQAPVAVAPDAGPIDRDHDGVADAIDPCPCVAEDRDGFQDDDGCVDPDNDGDRVLDVCDLCPNEAETYNGRCDQDGCPDRVPVYVMTQHAIAVIVRVEFDRGSAELDDDTAALLDSLASTMAEYPEITSVAILGRNEPREPHRRGLALRRAQAVLEALVTRGVARERLLAEADTAAIDPQTPAAQLRSVRFEIRGDPQIHGDGDVPPADACEIPVCDPPPTTPAC